MINPPSPRLVRILVEEDFAPFLQFISTTLATRHDLQVICEVSDGLEAVQKAGELRPDLILLDIRFPSLNGIEAARQIRKLVPESKIIFLTQESSDDFVEEALRLGACGYVIKLKAKRGDVDLKQRLITIRQSKTDAGERTIPLNDHAFAAMRELQAGARLECGDILRADWFCFAGRTPTAPITTWRRAWRSMLKAGRVPYSRFYDTRHTCITDLLQNTAASEQTVKAIVGHVSAEMLDRYSHTRNEAKRRAVENLPQRSLPTVSLHPSVESISGDR